MERRRFIKKTTIISGLSLLAPSILKAAPSHSSFQELPVLCHTRHGYYNIAESLTAINFHSFSRIKIDRFMNPDGDLVLFDLFGQHSQVSIGLLADKVWIHLDSLTREVAKNELTSIQLGKLRLIQLTPGEEIKIESNTMMLEGELSNLWHDLKGPTMISEFSGRVTKDSILLTVRH